MWEHRPSAEVARRILRSVFGPVGPTHIRTADPSVAGPGRSGTGSRRRAFPLTPFQEMAVARLRGILDRRGGALLADAVGLGKTYVGLALVEEHLIAGDDVVVVVPAALRSLWRAPLRRLGRGHPWRLVSHAQLSRGVAIAAPAGSRLIVVDEAHRFRNPATRRYRALARLADRPAAGGPRRDVLLITATPVNNALDDLYHLVRLFLPDHGLRDVGVPSLRGLFEGATVDEAGLQALVRELVVRRSRRMVEHRFASEGSVPGGPIVRFPDRASPRVHRYRDPRLPGWVAAIDALELAVYGDGAAPLVRLGLLKRMDSSPAALAVSAGRVREFLTSFADAAASGRLLRPADRRIAGDGDPFQLMLAGIVAGPAPPGVDLEALAASAQRDRRSLDRILEGLAAAGHPAGASTGSPSADRSTGGAAHAKEAVLLELLRSLHPERVLVFTEYRDTAESLWRALAGVVRVARIDGSGAWLGGNPAGRRGVVERFAPGANGRPPPPARERVDVLVATDVLAEGMNLQDARHVVSYDLPWNPVRLLQRVGRIDRLASPHDTVVPHLFVPAEGLDAVLGLTRRLRAKLHGIVTALGEAQADQLLDSLASGRDDRVSAALRAAEHRAAADPWEKLRTLWLRDRATPARGGASRGGASRCDASRCDVPGPSFAELAAPADTPAAELDAVVLVSERGVPAGAVGGHGRLLELRRDGRVTVAGAAGVAALEVAIRGPGVPGEVRRPAPDIDARLSAVAGRVERHFREQQLRDDAPTPVGHRDPAARLARIVRSTMADAGAALDPRTVRQAESALAALSTPLRPAQERAVEELLADGVERVRPGDLTGLVSAATAALGPAHAGATATPTPVVRAALMVTAAAQ